MFITDDYCLKREEYQFGPNVIYDATCDAMSVRDAEWPLSFPNPHNSCPCIQLKEIIQIAGDERVQIYICVSLSLMTDHTGRSYWDCRIEGDETNTHSMAPNPVEAFRLIYEELASGCI